MGSSALVYAALCTPQPRLHARSEIHKILEPGGTICSRLLTLQEKDAAAQRESNLLKVEKGLGRARVEHRREPPFKNADAPCVAKFLNNKEGETVTLFPTFPSCV